MRAAPTAPNATRTPAKIAKRSARRLFRYVAGEEWRDYRSIMRIFAGTFFAEFTPEDVGMRLAQQSIEIDGAVVGDRLEALRRWGNLTVSSSVGNPASIADYYKRRNRYLITPAGQQVHELVEGVLSHVDDVRDVSTGRLRTLLDALRALAATDVAVADPLTLADLVREVFDPHHAFTSEITQFFAAINQWQSRYDLSPDEFTFFAEVLVGYVAERLDEIERTARPIGLLLIELEPRFAKVAERANRGLAARVAAAGLADSISVVHRAGSTEADWSHLLGWFVTRPGRTSRIDQLGRDAVSAIRTLTNNLTRLSRVGVGAASRRADFLRLARMFADSPPEQAPDIAVAAFGLHGTNHWGVVAEDSLDPVSTATAWTNAPRALVPVALRERGETAVRGRASPLRDRAVEIRLLQRRREQESEARLRVEAELLAGPLTGRELSGAALARLERCLAPALHRLSTHGDSAVAIDGQLRCIVRRAAGHQMAIATADGTLVLQNLSVELEAAMQREAEGHQVGRNVDRARPTSLEAAGDSYVG